MTFDEIVSDFPELGRDDIIAVLEWSQNLIVAAAAAYDSVALIPSRAVPWTTLEALGRALGDQTAQVGDVLTIGEGLVALEAELTAEFGPIPEAVQRAADDQDWPS